MYPVEQSPPSDDFKNAWSAAGQHIQKQADSGLSWLRATLNPPMAEHLSFRIGNQIFFIFIEAAEFSYPQGKELFDKVCLEAYAIPCLMPMKNWFGKWKPSNSGWGLVHTKSNKVINPLDYVSNELIELTDWELHDFAIQVVCSHLEKEGKKVFSKQPSTEIDPSIWFEDSSGTHFVVVRSARYPAIEALAPSNISDIKQGCAQLSKSGYFASVVFASSEDPFDPEAKSNGNYLPIYRGHGVFPKFPGLKAL